MKDWFTLTKLNFFIKIMVVLLPLFFIPISPLQLGADNYSKYYLLGVFTILIAFAYFVIKKNEGEVSIRPTVLEKSLFALLFVSLVSSLMGASMMNSFFGNLSQTTLPFFSLLIFVLLYFLLVNIFNNDNNRLGVLKPYLYSFPLISIVSFVVVFFYTSHSLSAYLRLSMGNAEELSVYLTLLLILIFSIFSSEDLKTKLGINKNIKYLFNFSGFLAVILLLKIDFHYAWWILLFGMAMVIYLRKKYFSLESVSSSVKKTKFNFFRNKYFAPIFLALVSVNFLLNFYLVTGKASLEERYVQSRQLTNAQSIDLAKDTFFKNIFIGVGLENIDYAFSLYRNVEQNSHEYWDIRYNKMGSFILYFVVSSGLFGLLAVAFILYKLITRIKKYLVVEVAKVDKTQMTNTEENLLGLVLIPLILSGLISLFIYSANFNILFLLLIVTTLFMSSLRLEEGETFNFHFTSDNNRSRYLILALGLPLAFAIVYLTLSTKYLIADSGLGRSERSEVSLKRTVGLSPSRYQHNLNMAKDYLEKTKTLNAQGKINESLETQSKSLEYLLKAEEAGKNSVVAQESAGVIFRDLSEGGDGLNIMSIKAFERAVALEPSNPVLLTELGQAFLKSGDLVKAEENFRRTLELKSDYSQANLGLAKSIDGQGKKEEARVILEKLAKETGDPNVYYELGLSYFNEGKNKEAMTAFNSAVTLSPLHSNALYGLALAMEKDGDKEQAIFYLKKVQKLNPKNSEVNEKIKSLEK